MLVIFSSGWRLGFIYWCNVLNSHQISFTHISFSLLYPYINRSFKASFQTLIYYTRCLSIYYTLPPNKRTEPTSLSSWCRSQIAFSWILNVQAVSKLQLSSVMHSQLYYVAVVMLCYVNLLVDVLDLQRDAVIERRWIKEESSQQKKRLPKNSVEHSLLSTYLSQT